MSDSTKQAVRLRIISALKGPGLHVCVTDDPAKVIIQPTEDTLGVDAVTVKYGDVLNEIETNKGMTPANGVPLKRGLQRVRHRGWDIWSSDIDADAVQVVFLARTGALVTSHVAPEELIGALVYVATGLGDNDAVTRETVGPS